MKGVLAVLLFLAIAAGGLALLNEKEGGEKRTYLTEEVVRGKITVHATATGTVKAVATVDVGSQLSGQIDKVFVDFNDSVQENQLLARLDQRSFRARLREAEAAMSAAESGILIQQANVQVARSQLFSEEAGRDMLSARIARAEASLEAADLEFDRIKALRARSAVAESVFEEARTSRNLAALDLREVESERPILAQAIAMAEANLRRAEAELQNARAQFMQSKSRVELSQIELQRTEIRSPIKGVVIDRNIDDGQTVAASLEAPILFKIARDIREMEVHARVDEADIGKIHSGQTAEFRVDAYPGRAFQGRVTQIRGAPLVVGGVVTYTVVIATQNTDLLLLPGMTALVRIVVQQTADNILKIPNSALRFQPETGDSKRSLASGAISSMPFETTGLVWTVDEDGLLHPVVFQSGLSDGSMTEIATGELVAGQEVVVGAVSENQSPRLLGIRIGF